MQHCDSLKYMHERLHNRYAQNMLTYSFLTHTGKHVYIIHIHADTKLRLFTCEFKSNLMLNALFFWFGKLCVHFVELSTDSGPILCSPKIYKNIPYSTSLSIASDTSADAKHSLNSPE